MDNKTFWISIGPIVFVNCYFLLTFLIFPFVYKKMERLPDMVDNRHSSAILGKWVRYWWIWNTKPLFNFFVKFKFTPNQVSFVGTVMNFIAGIIFACGEEHLGVGVLGLGGWAMLIGGSLDFMDGRLARITNQESLAGAFFDSVMDRVAECAVLIGLAILFRDTYILYFVLFAFAGSMLTSYSKCRGDKEGVEYGGGIMQRPERVVYTGVGAVFAPLVGLFLLNNFPSHFENLADATYTFYAIPLFLVALLSNYTTYNRIANIMKLLAEKEAKEKS